MIFINRLLKRKTNTKISEAGFFSIEMIIVLIVALSILASSAGRIASLFTTSSSATMVSNVLELENNVRALRTVSGYGEVGTDLSKILVDQNRVPSGIIQRDSKLYNEWSGEITIKSYGDSMGFTITYEFVPKNVVSQVLPQMLNSGNFEAISVNDVTLKMDSSILEISKAISSSNTDKIKIVMYIDTKPD